MKHFLSINITIILACLPLAASAETATTIVETLVNEEPVFGTRAISTIPANTAVEVVTKKKLWCQVKQQETNNWVRCFNLKFIKTDGDNENNESSRDEIDSGVNRRDVIATIGIRGLNSSDLENAMPDPEQLEKLDGYQAESEAVSELADQKELTPRTIGYLGQSETDSPANQPDEDSDAL